MRRLWILLGAACIAPVQLSAQSKTVNVIPGPQYELSPFLQVILGSNWRDAWAREIRVPVLDLNTYAGGLTAFRQGGNQSVTLRLRGGDGKTYIFRSTDKFVHKALPEDLAHTPIGELVQDQSSTMHPTASLAVQVLQGKLDLLQARPQLVFMPDDPKLGEFRQTFGGMLGQLEERPEEASDSGPVSFGAKDIEDAEKMLRELEQTLDHKMVSREYLTARLIDFLTGDTDRGADQWRWARFERGDQEIWRPIPRDRDYAFMVANGLLPSIVRRVFAKIVEFGPRHSPLRSLTFMTQEFDRSHLVDLEWPAWDSLVTRMQAQLSDAVINEAVAKLPPEHQELNGPDLIAGLRARRDGLREIAEQYYRMVNREADVFASDEPDVAEIDRRRDGSVEVRLYSMKASQASTNGNQGPAFGRRFMPQETKEIRVYMQGGNDRVIVRGSAEHSIKVRVTGGAGDDVLIDSSSVAHGGHPTVFYDAHGNNTITAGTGTRVSEKPIVVPQPKEEYETDKQTEEQRQLHVLEERRGRFQDLLNTAGQAFFKTKFSAGAQQQWGGKAGFGPALDYREGAGLILGVGHTTTRFGFRHLPYESKIGLHGLYAIGSGGFGLQATGDFRTENSPLAFNALVRATQFEANRYFGYGNDTPDIGPVQSLVMREELQVHPALRLYFTPITWVSVGPVLRYVNSDPEFGSPADTLNNGLETFGQLGAKVTAIVDRRDDLANPTRGFTLGGAAAYYPAVWDATDAFGSANLQATAYIPLGKPSIALRLGGTRSWGSFPLHEAAFLGGRHTLRGFRWNRFAGDSELHSSAEVRVPIVRTTLLTRGTVGAFVFGDAGRVWMNGDSPGGWHTSQGVGLSFATLGAAFSAAFARGEHSRIYLQYGLPF